VICATARRDSRQRSLKSDPLNATAVYGAGRVRIGSTAERRIDNNGRVVYAMVSAGGFLGIGESKHAIPWKRLTYDPTVGSYRSNITSEELLSCKTLADAEEEADALLKSPVAMSPTPRFVPNVRGSRVPGLSELGEDLRRGAEKAGEDLRRGAGQVGEDLRRGAGKAGVTCAYWVTHPYYIQVMTIIRENRDELRDQGVVDAASCRQKRNEIAAYALTLYGLPVAAMTADMGRCVCRNAY
jgi:hypothetical protein